MLQEIEKAGDPSPAFLDDALTVAASGDAK
jgi:hypothetical protein